MKTEDLIHLSNKELISYIYTIQEELQNKLNSGLSIDDIIDNEDPFEALEPILQSLAPSANTGYGHVGPSGSGHFVKMMHNGIEYGMMQAFAEGFEIMKSKEEFHLDLTQISDIWRHGSVVRSWLLDLITSALKEEPGLESIDSYVEDSGEGRWAVQEGLDLNVPTPVISASLQTRFHQASLR